MVDWRWAMGDRDRGAGRNHLLQGALDLAFDVGVKSAGGLVQDQDPGILEDGAGQRTRCFSPPPRRLTELLESGPVSIPLS